MDEPIHRRAVGASEARLHKEKVGLKPVVQIPHWILDSTEFCRYETGLHKGTICHLLPQVCVMLGEGDL